MSNNTSDHVKNNCIKNALQTTLQLVPPKTYGGYWTDVYEARRKDDLIRFSVFANLVTSSCDVSMKDTNEMIKQYKELKNNLQ